MKAVIYARYSPRPRRKGGGQGNGNGNGNGDKVCESCDTQIALCQAWCASRDCEVVGVERDDAVSGRSTSGRPGLARALALAKRHRAAVVDDEGQIHRL